VLLDQVPSSKPFRKRRLVTMRVERQASIFSV
jgi:hypothetical protein